MSRSSVVQDDAMSITGSVSSFESKSSQTFENVQQDGLQALYSQDYEQVMYQAIRPSQNEISMSELQQQQQQLHRHKAGVSLDHTVCNMSPLPHLASHMWWACSTDRHFQQQMCTDLVSGSAVPSPSASCLQAEKRLFTDFFSGQDNLVDFIEELSDQRPLPFIHELLETAT